MRMLVVDPNVAFATLLTEELTRLGHDATACHSGEAAYAAAQRVEMDLALLDMGLEDPDAITLARDLRKLCPATRLILIPMMGEQLALGRDAPSIQGVLPKPFFIPELPDRIDAALSAAVLPAEPDGDLAPPMPATPPAAEPLAEADGGAWLPAMRDTVVEPTGQRRGNEPDADARSERRPVISRQAFRLNQGLIESLMRDLAREVGADGVLLTSESGLLTAVGTLEEMEIDSISRAVLQGWQTSAEMARILGREQLRFEQSIAGGTYMLYALSVNEAILALTVDGSAPLGLLRLRARATGERIAELCSAV